MDICSPKDGFVVKIWPKEGDSVEFNLPILQMDSEDEDKALERLKYIEAARKIRSAQYTGAQLKLLQDSAKLAIDKATATLETNNRANQEAEEQYHLGRVTLIGALLAKQNYELLISS